MGGGTGPKTMRRTAVHKPGARAVSTLFIMYMQYPFAS
ncbi:hypothetical protein [Azospirillum argentinense]